MDEHTQIFVALGAATAANCGPCFEHYYSKAEKLGISKDEIRKTVDIAVKVKGGAQMVMTGAIERTMKQDAAQAQDCCSHASGCCD